MTAPSNNTLRIGAIAVATCLLMTMNAEAHWRKYKHRHNNVGAVIGLGIAGAIVGGAIANGNRRSGHCHTNNFCHRHGSRGTHFHNSAGQTVYGKQRVRRVVGNRHVIWCSNKYRSYRVRDNTFQPYKGGRKRCRSPYG